MTFWVIALKSGAGAAAFFSACARNSSGDMRSVSATIEFRKRIVNFLLGDGQPESCPAGTRLLWHHKLMEIKRSGSQPSGKGPADWFTGTVRIDPLFQVKDPARAAGNSVTFEPGARTAWHTHPLGQTLIVKTGCGRAQRWGGPIEEIRPGDVIWIPPGEKHWHGAAATTAMTHIAIQEQLNGKAVEWMEKVSDEQYRSE